MRTIGIISTFSGAKINHDNSQIRFKKKETPPDGDVSPIELKSEGQAPTNIY